MTIRTYQSDPSAAWRRGRLAMAVSILAPALQAPWAHGAQALEEIVVTARKREESLQDVGFAVSALSRTEIERTFARDIKDLAAMSPNLVVDDTAQGPGGVAAIFIRGIGVADVEKNFDPAVGVVLDGVFIGANAGSLLRSIDLESVEVLRGPQGTLFGRNTIGGLINVRRTQPTGEFGGKIRVGVENYDTHYVDAILNFGVTDNLAAKLFYAGRDQQEGYYDNVSTGEEGVGANDYDSWGVNLLWTVREGLELEYTWQKEDTNQDTPPLLNTGQQRHLFCYAYGYCSPSLDKPITGDRFKMAQIYLRPGGPKPTVDNPIVASPLSAAVRFPGDATFDTEMHIVEGRWDISDAWRMDYIYGYWESDETILSDWDGTPDFLYHTDRPAQYEQQSHELRFTYDAGGRLSFVSGLYYWESEYAIQLQSYIGFAVPDTILDILQVSEQDTESRAIFFEADYELTDRLTLTAGGRYTEDEKESRQFGAVNTITPPYTSHPKEDWDEFTPRVGLRYQFTDAFMGYVTYARGYRSGGFNGRVGQLVEAREPYDPETVDDYEIGFKSELWEGRVRLNANVFYMEYDDKQEELQLPDTNETGQKTVVTNAASAELSGVEVDLQASLTDNLSLRANLGYLDSKYDEFSYIGLDGSVVDLSGLEFRRAPDWTGSLDLTYEWTVGRGLAWVRGSYHYLGDHYVNVQNSPELHNKDQHLFDASINFEVDDIRVSLFGRNLTDEDGYMHGYDVAGLWSYAATRPPRTFGAEVVYTFGAR
ncbi:MAG: TonB-dependent receptor [Porticoccaceae bacterium]|nr:MAG: TonB-dependent receptor [Porticoccaceae bacterium]